MILGLAAMAIFSISIAQPGPGRDFKRQHRSERGGMIGKNLDLTEAQQKEMKSLHESFRQEMRELQKLDQITVGEQRTRKEALIKSHHEKIQSLLTPEQKQKWEASKMGQGKTGAGRMGAGGMGAGKMGPGNRRPAQTGPQMDLMREKLNLTDQQVASIKASREANQSKMQAIRQNTELSQEQKMEKMKELRTEMQSGMEKILTPEQKSKWDSFRKEQPRGRKPMGPRPAKSPAV